MCNLKFIFVYIDFKQIHQDSADQQRFKPRWLSLTSPSLSIRYFLAQALMVELN